MKRLAVILFFACLLPGLAAVGCAHNNKETKATSGPDMSPEPLRPPPAQ
jgi:hypothetical protein